MISCGTLERWHCSDVCCQERPSDCGEVSERQRRGCEYRCKSACVIKAFAYIYSAFVFCHWFCSSWSNYLHMSLSICLTIHPLFKTDWVVVRRQCDTIAWLYCADVCCPERSSDCGSVSEGQRGGWECRCQSECMNGWSVTNYHYIFFYRLSIGLGQSIYIIDLFLYSTCV